MRQRLMCFFATVALLGAALSSPSTRAASYSFGRTIAAVQPKMVKVYGAGGLRGLEAYQSGFLISPEGHILTVWSYVLDTDDVTVVLDDGRRFRAQVLGADPRVEIAVLKIEATELPHFRLAEAVELAPGAKVLAFSNLFAVAVGDEPVSVLQGIVSAKTPLSARRGAFETTYRGPAYVLDAMTNNPGSAGGALTDRDGRLAGLLGKEVRHALDNTWLNYAIPIPELSESVEAILSGSARPRQSVSERRRPAEPMTLIDLGIVLIPEVVAKTPPYVDQVRVGSPAAKAGLRPDDLILFLDDRMIGSARTLREELGYIDRIDEVRLVVQRGQQLLEVSLFAD